MIRKEKLSFRVKRKILNIKSNLLRAIVSLHKRDNNLIVYGGALDLFIDNAKHLYGAVRLIRRQLTDDNAAIYLLAAFCLMFLDINSNNTNKNKVLEEELANMYIDGMKEFYKRLPHDEFWSEVFEKYNQNEYVATYFRDNGGLLKSAAALEIHKEELKDINNKYTA